MRLSVSPSCRLDEKPHYYSSFSPELMYTRGELVYYLQTDCGGVLSKCWHGCKSKSSVGQHQSCSHFWHIIKSRGHCQKGQVARVTL